MVVATVSLEVAVTESCAFVPCAGRGVEHPSRIRVRKVQHVERVTVLLVGVPHSIRQVAVLLNGKLNRVGRYAHALVAVRSIDDALAASVSAKPKDAVIHLGDGVRRNAADLVVSALDTRQREIGLAAVVPNLNAVGAKEPRFAVVDNERHQAVGRTFGRGKVKRVNGRAIKQRGDPNALTVGFVENEIAVQISNRYRAGEVRVGDLRKRVRSGVVDVSVWIRGNKNLCAVVRHRHRAGARYHAKRRVALVLQKDSAAIFQQQK